MQPTNKSDPGSRSADRTLQLHPTDLFKLNVVFLTAAHRRKQGNKSKLLEKCLHINSIFGDADAAVSSSRTPIKTTRSNPLFSPESHERFFFSYPFRIFGNGHMLGNHGTFGLRNISAKSSGFKGVGNSGCDHLLDSREQIIAPPHTAGKTEIRSDSFGSDVGSKTG